MMRVELLRTRDQLLALQDQWDALWARSSGEYYLSFLSCLLSWDTLHAPRRRKLAVAVALEGERLVAALPMTTYRRGLWTIASPLGPEAAEGCDILQASAAAAELAPQLLDALVRRTRADVLALPFVRAESALDRAIRAAGRLRTVTHVDTMPCALLHDEADWDGYERSLGRGTQSQTARKARRLQDAGGVTIERVEGPADAAIDWLLDEKAAWGRKVGKTGSWLFSPSYRAYLKGYAAAGATGSGTMLTFALRLDGALAAVKTIVVGPTLCTLVIAAYDEALSRFSPGNILDEVWVRYVFDTYRDADGRRLDINFGVGVERYKLHWGRGVTFDARTYKVAVTRWGELPYRLKAARAAIARLRDTWRPPAAPGASVTE